MRGRSVNPGVERVVKFLPNSPPERGDILLVNDRRVRVVRCRVKWNGYHWTIRSLRVKDAA